MSQPKLLRLILGDQLNSQHSWFKHADPSILYVMMEIRTETDYVTHHIQKIIAFFAAMRAFADWLTEKGHSVIYLTINDPNNLQSFEQNIKALVTTHHITSFQYLLPDEYRVDQILKKLSSELSIPTTSFDTEHFYTTRTELQTLFEGKKQLLMETFYRAMRKKHNVLMRGDKPLHDKWNFDEANRKKLPKHHKPPEPISFNNNVEAIYDELQKTTIKTMGYINVKTFIWPVNRAQSLALLHYFTRYCLPLFGTYQDAMMTEEWSLYHSRLSFSLNTKLLSPKEVVDAAISAYNSNHSGIDYNQIEGFVRQIIGWREYMRGIYWMHMPAYNQLNFFNHKNNLPKWYWDGATKMNCLKHAIKQSLTHAYAHHIQRLMITGNFALLSGTEPTQVDEWYLGIYIDALDWVEITNTRGMSQFADGGIVGTKPYVSSAAYIHKMSNYCEGCFYDKSKKTGHNACPFNSLYWDFYNRHADKLATNPRIGMMYTVWNRMNEDDKTAILKQANWYLHNINNL